MDTYWHTNHHCINCGDCVDACEIDGQNWLDLCFYTSYDGEPQVCITGVSDYTPCHHCSGFWEDKTPCQMVCPVNAIEITRW